MFSIKRSEKIGIVGLGLIGGSLGIDLQRLGHKVYGLTNREITANKAKKRGLAQVISTDPKIISECSLVIIALPLEKLLNPKKSLITALPPNAVITDVGSVKTPVIKVWEKLHPRFVASHPMAGTNKAGVEAGKQNLFKTKPWIATPNEKTDQEALEIVRQLAISIGSQWLTTDSYSHDHAVALISHLPVFIGASLIKSISNHEKGIVRNLAQTIASTGFTDTSRVGGGNPELGVAMARYNTSNILESLEKYQQALENIKECIKSENWTKLEEELKDTQKLRADFLERS